MIGKRKKAVLCGAVILILLLGMILYCHFENTNIEISEIQIEDADIPKEFDGYKMIHISDLHNAEFGKGNESLLSKIKANQPSVIVITGDLVDSRKTDIHIALNFIENAIKIAPIYYVTGNHEARMNAYSDLAEKMEALGVTMLDHRATTLKSGGAEIGLIGLADPSFAHEFGIDTATVFSKHLDEMNACADRYTVLLSHRPEAFDFYVENNIDLVFCGHAHGGQVRLPFLGGVIAPNQGIFPKYTSGVYENGNTKMIVSRGLGNSIFPFRVNNNPQIIVVTLKTSD